RVAGAARARRCRRYPGGYATRGGGAFAEPDARRGRAIHSRTTALWGEDGRWDYDHRGVLTFRASHLPGSAGLPASIFRALRDDLLPLHRRRRAPAGRRRLAARTGGG